MILCIKLLPYMQYRYTVILQEIMCGGNISTNRLVTPTSPLQAGNAVNLRIYSNSPNFFFDIYIHT